MYEFLTTLNFSPDIVCLTVTRIKSQPLINVEILNYSFVHVDSESTTGGVTICVSDRFQYELRSNQYHLTGTKCLSLNIYESNSKKEITVGVVYRHPNQSEINEFMECFSNRLSDLSKSKNVYFILGNFNINIHSGSRTT